MDRKPAGPCQQGLLTVDDVDTPEENLNWAGAVGPTLSWAWREAAFFALFCSDAQEMDTVKVPTSA